MLQAAVVTIGVIAALVSFCWGFYEYGKSVGGHEALRDLNDRQLRDQ